MGRETHSSHRAAEEHQPSQLAPADDAIESLLGKQLGNYVIERPLARGGMGTLYVARHLSLDRLVAVKVLSDDVSDSPGLAGRFRDEARVTANLRHPNIVEIFDFGMVEGHHYYVMELLRGQDLATYLLGKGHLPLRVAVRCLQQICSALSAVHGAGVIHRDLKPGNVFVVDESPFRVKLVDFGIAKIADRSQDRTRYGQIIGSPCHMAPEQALGYTDKISPQSDLYALGALGYEMLAGQPVFQHESELMLLMMHIQEPFTPLRRLVPDVPEDVASIIEACLAKDPKERPPSARYVMEQLARATGEGDYLLQLTHEERASPEPLPPSIVLPVSAALPSLDPPSPLPSLIPPQPSHPALQLASEPPTASPTAQPLPIEARPAVPIGMVAGTRTIARATPPSGPIELSREEDELLGRLLKRMKAKGDFPAFIRNVGEVSRRADAESVYSARQLGDAILRDYALTAKLLRIVNQSYAGRFGSKVFSVKHAIVLLGFDRVRSIAVSISLFKSSAARDKAKRVTDSAISSIVTGELARSLAARAGVGDAEYAMICAMFRSLGHHLAMVYLPEEYDRMLEIRETAGVDLERAAERVLGISLRKLGVGIARRWQLPDRMLAAMGAHVSAGRSLSQEEARMKALAEFASSLCEIVVTQSPGTWEGSLAELLSHHRDLVRLDISEIPPLLRAVRDSFAARYASLGLDTEVSRFSHNVATLPPVGEESSFRNAAQSTHQARVQAGLGRSDRARKPKASRRAPPLGEHGPAILPLQLAKSMADVAVREVGTSPPGDPALPHQELLERVQELSDKLGGRLHRNRILVMTLELLSKYLDLPRVIALVPSADRKELVVQAAVGEDADGLRTELSFPLRSRRARGDMFTTAFHDARDVVVEDTFAPKARCLIPVRYFEAIGSSAFVLLACSVMGRTSVLLLADRDDRRPLPSRETLSNMSAIRLLLVRAAR